MSLKRIMDNLKLWFCKKTGVVPPNPAYFIWLCKHASAKEIEKAARNGVDVNAMFGGTISGLMYAIANRRETDVLEKIIQVGCDPDAQGASGETALMIACARGYGEDAITMILEYGANPDIKTSEGLSALDFARDAKNEAAAKAIEQFQSPEAE